MEARQRINSGMINSHVGKEVCMVGKIDQIINNNRIKLLACDGRPVMINVMEPLKENLTGVIEIIGKVEVDFSIAAHSIVSLVGTNDFDLNLYNDAIAVTTKYSELFMKS